ncbi:MAG: ABC transporter ATP-binding protein [Parachlamydiales bacterium]|jgi:ABC-type multidrug transport system ATPase subunit
MNQILLKIKNVGKFYSRRKKAGLKKALDGVSLELYQKEIFSLLGVNGAGKTTLSSIIASLIPPTAGELLWQERSIYTDLAAYRRQVGLCPQTQNLDASLNLEEGLIFQGFFYGLKKKQARIRAEKLLKRFDLEEYAGSKIEVLSGGYRQRFLIAKALVHDPGLVILDEPTVGLDPQVRHKLWKYILDLKQEGKTVVLTTHYLDEAEKLSDRVCLLDQGKIKTLGTPEQLKRDLKKENLEAVFLHLLKEEGQT